MTVNKQPGVPHNPLPKTERGWRKRAKKMKMTIEECKANPNGVKEAA